MSQTPSQVKDHMKRQFVGQQSMNVFTLHFQTGPLRHLHKSLNVITTNPAYYTHHSRLYYPLYCYTYS